MVHWILILEYAKLVFMDIQNDLLKRKRSISKAASLLKAIGNYERLMILCQLVDGEVCVGDLSKLSSLSQSAFSQHLGLLRKNKLVKINKISQTIYYSIADQSVLKILNVLHDIYCS